MSSGIPGQQWRLASMAPPARKQQAQTAEPTTPPPPSSPPHTHTHNTAHSPPASHLGDLLWPAQLVEQQVQEVCRQRRGRDRGLQARLGRHALLHHRAKRRVARRRAACGAPGAWGDQAVLSSLPNAQQLAMRMGHPGEAAWRHVMRSHDSSLRCGPTEPAAGHAGGAARRVPCAARAHKAALKRPARPPAADGHAEPGRREPVRAG